VPEAAVEQEFGGELQTAGDQEESGGERWSRKETPGQGG
jgi:hypothetical protein